MTVEEIEKGLGVDLPAAVVDLLRSPRPYVAERLCQLEGDARTGPRHILSVAAALRTNPDLPPFGLIPLLYVDEASYACLVAAPSNVLPAGVRPGHVVRCFLARVPPRFQAALLDTDAEEYVLSVDDELRTRAAGLSRLDKISRRYHEDFVHRGEAPKAQDERPVRFACQNVVIGVAAFRHDRSTDSLAVPVWQTCEVPHVATHEGNRAMTALMLSDAFNCGSTMEIRFDKHVERRVPAALSRFARSRNVTIDAHSMRITPDEARELMLAVTPFPEYSIANRSHPRSAVRRVADTADLLSGTITSGAPRAAVAAERTLTAAPMRDTVLRFCARHGVTPERVCYLILSGVWRTIEMDHLLRVTPGTAAAVVKGEHDPLDRPRSQEVLAACRAALLIGLVHTQMQASTVVGAELEVLEDARVPVSWDFDGSVVVFRRDGASATDPWSGRDVVRVLAAPRGVVLDDATALDDGETVLLVPEAANTTGWRGPVVSAALTPSDLDASAVRNLMSARVGRK